MSFICTVKCFQELQLDTDNLMQIQNFICAKK